MKKLDYIITNPNKKVYLQVDKTGRIVTCTKQQAQRFEYSKAKNIVKHIPKVLSKFHFKVEPLYEKINNTKQEKENQKKKEEPKEIIINHNYIIPDNVAQWVTKVKNTPCYILASEAEKRHSELVNALSCVDKEVSNRLHCIELYPWKNACAGYYDYKTLKTVLEKRRTIKDELCVVNEILQSNIQHIALNHIESVVKGLENRVFELRDSEEFKNIG